MTTEPPGDNNTADPLASLSTALDEMEGDEVTVDKAMLRTVLESVGRAATLAKQAAARETTARAMQTQAQAQTAALQRCLGTLSTIRTMANLSSFGQRGRVLAGIAEEVNKLEARHG